MDEINGRLWELSQRLEDKNDVAVVVDASDIITEMDSELDDLRDEIVRLKDHLDRMETALNLWVEYDEGDEQNSVQMMIDYNTALVATKAALSRLAED